MTTMCLFLIASDLLHELLLYEQLNIILYLWENAEQDKKNYHLHNSQSLTYFLTLNLIFPSPVVHSAKIPASSSSYQKQTSTHMKETWTTGSGFFQVLIWG